MGLENASNDCDAENQIDFIGNLHKMSATHVVEKIVSYFDADSMRNSKSVSIMWNNALGELNEEKFWQDLLKQKIHYSNTWKYLNEVHIDNIENRLVSAVENRFIHWGSKTVTCRSLYGKFEFAVKETNESWIKGIGYTRDINRLSKEIDVIGVLIVLEKYLVDYNENEKLFRIINRETLALKMTFLAKGMEPFWVTPGIIVSRIIHDVFVYPTKNCELIFVNLSKGTHKVQSPIEPTEHKSYITFLHFTEHQLSVCVETWDCVSRLISDVYFWKYDDVNNLDWKTFEKMTYDGNATLTATCDGHFLYIQNFQGENVDLDVRLMASLKKKINLKSSSIYKTNNCLFYDGFIIFDEKNIIKLIDVSTGIEWQIWDEEDQNHEFRKLFISADSLYACGTKKLESQSSNNYPDVSLLTVSSWKLIDVIKEKETCRLMPFRRIQACVPNFEIIYANDVCITTVNFDPIHNDITIHQLNFVPRCSFCKNIQLCLLTCPLCKSVKYCNAICEELDNILSHEKRCPFLAHLNGFQEEFDSKNFN